MSLLLFSVENYRSFKDIISFTTETYYDNICFKNYLIYGYNSSGKSNLVSAIQVMRDVVLNSAIEMNLGSLFNIEQFKLNGECENKPTQFNIEFLHKDVIYLYGFSLNKYRIYIEWLSYKHDGIVKELFNREYDKINDSYRWKFSKKLKGENKRISKFVRPNSLYLSHAAQNNHTTLGKLFLWFNKLEVINDCLKINYRNSDGCLNDLNFKYFICDLLKYIDHTIVSVDYTDEFIIIHLVESSMKKVHIKLAEESNSVKKMFYYALHIYNVIVNKGVLVFDDIDKEFDVEVINYIIRMFQDNLDCQLIFTSKNKEVLNCNFINSNNIITLTKQSFDKTYAKEHVT